MPLLPKPLTPSSSQRRVRWQHLHGSAAALALAESLPGDPRLRVIVTAGARELERLAAQLRFFGGPGLEVLALPDWEVLPYELSSPHPDIVSARLNALYRLPRARGGCLIIAADTLLQRLPPREYVEGRTFGLTVGEALRIEPFRARLVEAGYASVSQVSGPGELSVRGSLVDVFPMGSEHPLRIDLFGDQIEAIRRFDPETQRSLDSIARVELLPAREVPLDPAAVRDFRRRYRTRFEGDPMRSAVYRGVSEGRAPPGIEWYLPL
ncbi:MAG: transcription-repair coupling factor, partial [Steroidobacteraceae bacterium]